MCPLLDTGSTMSTINFELYNEIKQTTKSIVNIGEKQCMKNQLDIVGGIIYMYTRICKTMCQAVIYVWR